MALWTLFGLKSGKATTGWPQKGAENGQRHVLGMPRHHPERCRAGCDACAAVCLPGAIQIAPDADAAGPSGVRLDYGRCIHCQYCVDACASGGFSASHDWAFGVRRREDLIWAETPAAEPVTELNGMIRRIFGRSLHIRHVDAGSCNGCESELQALNNPFYNLHRLGVFFTASPRFADLLLVTGPVTYAMRDPLNETYRAMPDPRWIMAVGACAVSGGIAGGGYACQQGVDDILPVDIYLPGCPPNPAALINALLLLLGREKQSIQGGKIAE
ncbi:MAG TPA: NADH:ubiquinone oxidoreductase [Betaproteobacteria bacterium]|nr:NADH:ubiquinone oxidoreductase [Betaproteobacteria bacterium]